VDDVDPLRVFISSKQAEFTAEREALATIIRKMPLLAPVTAEAWSPERADVRERFLADVRRCPIYVGLFGCVFSGPTVVEYETACENPRREILIYIKRCPSDRVEPSLRPVLEALRAKHTVTEYDAPAQLQARFRRHLWSAVKRMIDAYIELRQPAPVAQGSQSVLRRLWDKQRVHLRDLGLPGDLSPEDAGRWAERLGSMLQSHAEA
jgi:Domain of unknown function (DUF4062)